MDLTITVVKGNFHCLPDALPDFDYTEIGVVGVDGFVDSERSAEIRRAQEMFDRLKHRTRHNVMINECKNKSEFR